MATTTLKAIIDRFQSVCEGDSVQLAKAIDEFSFDREPNATVNAVYRIADAGLQETQSLTNQLDARVDLLTVWVARKAALNSQAERETMELTLNTIERKILADGLSNNYHARIESREVALADNTDVLVGQLTFTVDYDYALT